MICPHCGWTRRGLRLPALCFHMMNEHDGDYLVPERRNDVFNTRLIGCLETGWMVWMVCWCGLRVEAAGRNRRRHSQWARHIEERGGLAAHLLEIAMDLGGEVNLERLLHDPRGEKT